MGNEEKSQVVASELARLLEIQKDMGELWLAGTQDVLRSRNPELLAELTKTEGIIDSLLVLGPKPTILQKQLDEALKYYSVLISDCATYARRHLPAPTATAVMN